MVRMLSRRTAVLGGAALLTAPAGLVRAAPAAPASASASTCILTPQATEGPYWFDPDLNRADVSEGRQGTPLRLRVEVLNFGDGCAALTGARVDIWHCDAAGLYSGYRRQGFSGGTDTRGETYLRGWQATGADGIAEFRTIYPGTYPIRVTHIHVKAFLDGAETLTAQIYFPEEATRGVYRAAGDYAESVANVRPNSDDRLARDQGESMVAAMSDADGVLTADVAIGVRA